MNTNSTNPLIQKTESVTWFRICLIFFFVLFLTAFAPPTTVDTNLTQIKTEELTYEILFQKMAASYGIDWRLLASLAYHESHLDPKAIGTHGEYGLMQIRPSTWDEIASILGLTNPFDPYSNVLAGTAYLAMLDEYMHLLGHDEEYWSIVAYNWGPNNTRLFLQSGGSWEKLPYSIQLYTYNIFEELKNPSSPLWTQHLKQTVP